MTTNEAAFRYTATAQLLLAELDTLRATVAAEFKANREPTLEDNAQLARVRGRVNDALIELTT